VTAAEHAPPAVTQPMGMPQPAGSATGAPATTPLPWVSDLSQPVAAGTAEPAAPVDAPVAAAPAPPSSAPSDPNSPEPVPATPAEQTTTEGSAAAAELSSEESADQGDPGLNRHQGKGRESTQDDNSDPPTGSFERLVIGKRNPPPSDPDPRAAAHRLS
jgi:hypothetical protein